VRKTVSRVLSIALALGLCVSSGGFAHAGAGAGGFEANSKNSRKSYLKHQKKQKKQFNKESKKSQKQIKKQHGVGN
jgi:hypothetical protein